MRAKEAFQRTFARRSSLRSLVVALIVGSILNFINQGSEVADGQPLIIWKLLLTYLVPFLVASYGSFSALRNS